MLFIDCMERWLAHRIGGTVGVRGYLRLHELSELVDCFVHGQPAEPRKEFQQSRNSSHKAKVQFHGSLQSTVNDFDSDWASCAFSGKNAALVNLCARKQPSAKCEPLIPSQGYSHASFPHRRTKAQRTKRGGTLTEGKTGYSNNSSAIIVWSITIVLHHRISLGTRSIHTIHHLFVLTCATQPDPRVSSSSANTCRHDGPNAACRASSPYRRGLHLVNV